MSLAVKIKQLETSEYTLKVGDKDIKYNPESAENVLYTLSKKIREAIPDHYKISAKNRCIWIEAEDKEKPAVEITTADSKLEVVKLTDAKADHIEGRIIAIYKRIESEADKKQLARVEKLARLSRSDNENEAESAYKNADATLMDLEVRLNIGDDDETKEAQKALTTIFEKAVEKRQREESKAIKEYVIEREVREKEELLDVKEEKPEEGAEGVSVGVIQKTEELIEAEKAEKAAFNEFKKQKEAEFNREKELLEIQNSLVKAESDKEIEQLRHKERLAILADLAKLAEFEENKKILDEKTRILEAERERVKALRQAAKKSKDDRAAAAAAEKEAAKLKKEADEIEKKSKAEAEKEEKRREKEAFDAKIADEKARVKEEEARLKSEKEEAERRKKEQKEVELAKEAVKKKQDEAERKVKAEAEKEEAERRKKEVENKDAAPGSSLIERAARAVTNAVNAVLSPEPEAPRVGRRGVVLEAYNDEPAFDIEIIASSNLDYIEERAKFLASKGFCVRSPIKTHLTNPGYFLVMQKSWLLLATPTPTDLADFYTITGNDEGRLAAEIAAACANAGGSWRLLGIEKNYGNHRYVATLAKKAPPPPTPPVNPTPPANPTP